MGGQDGPEKGRSAAGGFLRSRAAAVLFVFLTIAGFLLVHEHQAHLVGGHWLLGGFILICLLMLVFLGVGRGQREQSENAGERK